MEELRKAITKARLKAGGLKRLSEQPGQKVPHRTLEAWEQGHNAPAPYVAEMVIDWMESWMKAQ